MPGATRRPLRGCCSPKQRRFAAGREGERRKERESCCRRRSSEATSSSKGGGRGGGEARGNGEWWRRKRFSLSCRSLDRETRDVAETSAKRAPRGGRLLLFSQASSLAVLLQSSRTSRRPSAAGPPRLLLPPRPSQKHRPRRFWASASTASAQLLALLPLPSSSCTSTARMPVSADSLTAILQGAYPDATHIVSLSPCCSAEADLSSSLRNARSPRRTGRARHLRCVIEART